MRWAVRPLLAPQMFGEVHGESDPFAVFQPIAAADADREQLDCRAPLVKALAAEGQEIAAWLDRLAPLDDFLNRLIREAA